jgi:hypothetical protein
MAYIGKSIESGTFSVLDTSGNTYNGSNTTFNLGTQVGSVAQLLVSHDGVIQKPGTDYTLASGGTQITFTTAPASGASIFIVEISGAVGGPLDADLNGTELILDADGDTSLHASTDDQIDIKIAGADDFSFTANTFTAASGSSIVVPDGGLTFGSTAIASTAAELNLLDGGASVGGSITLADADGIVVNDGGTMKTIPASDVKTYVGSSPFTEVNAHNFTYTSTTNPALDIIDSTNSVKARFQAGNTTAVFGSASNHPVVFIYGSGESEAMRIDNSNGVLAIGTTSISGSPSTSCLELKGTEAPLSIINETATDASDRTSIAFRQANGTMVGNVGVDSSSTIFNTSSDYRLKENEVTISDGIERIKQLKPYKFNFKIQADKTVDGFFAHEVSSIVPEAITGEKDATETLQKVVLDSSGNIVAFNVEQSKWTQGKTDGDYANDTTWEASKEIIKPQSIDQSKLVPLLTAALKEAVTEIESLKARVTTLEG